MSLRNQIDEGSPERPADFTLEETLAIIGAGGRNGRNKALASLLAENAANKNAVAVSGTPGVNAAALEQIRAAVAEGVQKVFGLAAGILTHGYPVGHGEYRYGRYKPYKLYRYTYESGGRGYVIPMMRARDGFHVLLYDDKGNHIREGVARQRSMDEVMRSFARSRDAYDLGCVVEKQEVDDSDVFKWFAELAMKKSCGPLLTAQGPLPDNILAFKPKKELGA
jgi:hypothetical protein